MLARKVEEPVGAKEVLAGYEMAAGGSLSLEKAWETDEVGGKGYVGHTGQQHRDAAIPYLE